MTLDAATAQVLAQLSSAQVDALADACDGLGGAPAALPGIVAGARPGAQQAVRDLLAAWTARPGLTGPGVALALRTGRGLREEAEARRSSAVWTGPNAPGEARLTASTIHQLLTQAGTRVLLVSYAAYTLPLIADDLKDAVERGCVVDVVFETSDDNEGYKGPATAFDDVEGIRRWRWPKEQRPQYASLHTKLLVIDGRRALIGSANLTDAALTRNLEAGLLIRDAALAADLEQHVRRLMEADVLCRV